MATKETTLQALARLEHNHDFQEVLEHLRGMHEVAIETLEVASEPIQIGRAQGQAQVLGTFLKLACNARTIVQRRV